MAKPAAAPVHEILFATDFSGPSEAAGRVALDYARQFGARLHLLHVTWPGSQPEMPPALGKLAGEFGKSVPVVTATEWGTPAPKIVQYAGRNRIGLIVLGTHGQTGVSRVLIGSVAEAVVRTAPCPVLTVPELAAAEAAVVAEEAETPALRRCLVCATPSEDLICSPCRARIRGEAVERKQREERAGRT